MSSNDAGGVNDTGNTANRACDDLAKFVGAGPPEKEKLRVVCGVGVRPLEETLLRFSSTDCEDWNMITLGFLGGKK